MTTNSAGLSGAKPTRMLTMPRSMSFCGCGFVVALDEISVARRLALKRALAEKALHKCADIEPDLRPKRLIVRLKDDPLRPAIERLSSMKSAVRRTGMYFHSDARRSSPSKVRAPQTTRPAAGMARRQLMPSGFSSPCFRIGQWD